MAPISPNLYAKFLASILLYEAGCKWGQSRHDLPPDGNVPPSGAEAGHLPAERDSSGMARNARMLDASFEGRIYYDQLVYKSSEEERRGTIDLNRIKARSIDRTLTLAIKGDKARLDTADARVTLRCQQRSRKMKVPEHCLQQYQLFDSASRVFRLVDPNLRTVLESYATRRTGVTERDEVFRGPRTEVNGIACQRLTVRRPSGVPEVSLCLADGLRGDVLLQGSYVSDITVLSSFAPVLPIEAVGLVAGRVVSYLVINRLVPEALPEALFGVPPGYVIQPNVLTQKKP